jgi:cell division protein FtsX
MGIHYTYKSQSGERNLRKQQKQEELRRRSDQRKQSKEHTEPTPDVYVVPDNEVVTLDHLTNPDLKK